MSNFSFFFFFHSRKKEAKFRNVFSWKIRDVFDGLTRTLRKVWDRMERGIRVRGYKK